jgi:hypothetical protein
MKKGPMGSTPAVRRNRKKTGPAYRDDLVVVALFWAMAVVQLEQYYAGMDRLVMLSQVVVVVLVYWRLSSPGWAEMRVTSPG